MKDSYIIIPIDSMEAASIVDKMDGTNLIVKDIATVNFGMQLRDRKKYPADVTTDETLLTHYHRPCYTGKNIGEYMVEYEGLYCYFNREAKKGGVGRKKHSWLILNYFVDRLESIRRLE